MGNFKLDYFTF